MEFFDLVEKRRSVRVFKPEPLSDELVMKIVEAARLAPSAGNIQPYEILLVRDDRIKIELVQAALGQGFIGRAPVVLVFIEDSRRTKVRYGIRGERLYVHQDTAIAATFAHLAATDLGLGSCWVGAFDSAAAARILNLRDGLVPTVILPIGYPDEDPEVSPRREMAEILHKI